MSKGIRALSMSELEEQASSVPIFAINSSAESAVGRAGEILLGIPKINGTKVDPLRIAQTWLPVELTRQISRSQLLAASEFRQAIDSKLIILISAADAQKLEKQSGARHERERIAAAQTHVRTASAARTISDSTAEISRADGGQDEDDSHREESHLTVAQQAAAGVENTEDGITPSFSMWADRLALDTDIGATNTMRSKGRFSKKELRYLLVNLPNHPKTIARIKKVLAGGK